MATVAILGAGAMGSALATPAAAAGNRVRLWGTWLDGELLAELRAGRPHPRTGVPADPRVELHDAGALAAALDGADLVAVAISSDGVLEVVRRAAAALAPGTPLLLCTKGFGRHPGGAVDLLPPLVSAALGPLAAACPVVAVGGPCKANEVAAGRPTAAVFAGPDQAVVTRCARALTTPAYRVACSDDLAGVEAAAATKNVYAIAVGVCHGLTEAGGEPWHDLAAAAFAQAVGEMRRLAAALGGREETVLGLAGLGDLEVTSLSGRNRVFGNAGDDLILDFTHVRTYVSGGAGIDTIDATLDNVGHNPYEPDDLAGGEGLDSATVNRIDRLSTIEQVTYAD